MDEAQLPVCPHCESRIKGIEWFNEESANLIVFVCPHCRKILSVQKIIEPVFSLPTEQIIPKPTDIM